MVCPAKRRRAKQRKSSVIYSVESFQTRITFFVNPNVWRLRDGIKFGHRNNFEQNHIYWEGFRPFLCG